MIGPNGPKGLGVWVIFNLKLFLRKGRQALVIENNLQQKRAPRAHGTLIVDKYF